MRNSSNITSRNVIVLLAFIFIVLLLEFCTSQTDSITAPMKRTEQEALYSAIQGFVGKSWNGSDLYPDPCGWTPIQGVSCDFFDGYWYVTGMSIGPTYDNSLTCTQNARLTPHLFELNHLKSLSFSSCFISNHPVRIPTTDWEKLANSLESLEFRSNIGLVGTLTTTIGCLKNLQSLVLQENGLTSELPMEVGNLLKLRRLVLAGNRFTGRIPASFGSLSNLLILDFSRNNLSGSLPVTFGGLKSLLKLDLSNNMLEGKLPREIGNLKNLTLLDLRSNKFSGGLVQSFQEMVSLKEMVISNNPMGGDLMGIQWWKLKNLEILDLSNIGLIGNIPMSMTELERLRYLGLDSNNLSGNVPPRLSSMPCIGALYLNGNNFTGELGIPEGFLRKMGTRFRAGDNPYLCYRADSMPKSNLPHGVKLCQEENGDVIKVGSNVAREGNLYQNFRYQTSLGFPRCDIDRIWWVFMLQEVLVFLILFM